METELAKHVVTVGFHKPLSTRRPIPLLRKHCGDEEYHEYVKSIATVAAAMSTEIFNKIFRQRAELETEVEQKNQ